MKIFFQEEGCGAQKAQKNKKNGGTKSILSRMKSKGRMFLAGHREPEHITKRENLEKWKK